MITQKFLPELDRIPEDAVWIAVALLDGEKEGRRLFQLSDGSYCVEAHDDGLRNTEEEPLSSPPQRLLPNQTTGARPRGEFLAVLERTGILRGTRLLKDAKSHEKQGTTLADRSEQRLLSQLVSEVSKKAADEFVNTVQQRSYLLTQPTSKTEN